MPPVDDVEVHPSTVKGSHPGCYNRKPSDLREGYYVRVLEVDQHSSDGEVRSSRQWISHSMSNKCRQVGQRWLGVWREFDECVGCTAEKDIEYIKEMRAKE